MTSFRLFLPLASLGMTLAPAAALAQHEAHHKDQQPARVVQPAADAAAERVGDPYPLATCPVSGEELDGMGAAVVRLYDGREIRFCCEDCVPRFEADREAYTKQIDEEIIRTQLPFYSMTTCVVSGEPLVEDGEDIAINHVVNNRLVRFCCKMCRRDFTRDPEQFLADLDIAMADAQREDYPLDTCPVSGEELGGMGEPFEVVMANRLVRLCCEMCTGKLQKNPTGYLASLDRAWKAAGMDLDLPESHDAAHDEAAGHDHDGHDH